MGLRPGQKKRGSFKSESTLQEIGGKEDSSSEPLRLPLLGVRLHPCPAGRSQRDACVKSPDVRPSADELVQETLNNSPPTTPKKINNTTKLMDVRRAAVKITHKCLCAGVCGGGGGQTPLAPSSSPLQS
ncbi:hypothetical protein OJAV_G00008210 [Oryzias javanicus]|uniref:Uncharacterized protein n=1 Tax=Oryzias javanicus TaxID=123683 RepID=A0A3S2UQV8_ORYJA|nr:hypothetical protein OJAV_G00008210 [Oryzias javanicus]